MENNTIMPFAKVGNNVLVFVGNIIAHHMIIEDHATLTSHCAIGGNVIIKEGAFLGLNCTIRNGVVVNKKAIVSASSNVVKDVAEFDVVMGNPAKSIGKRSTEITL
jgi:acetyltransferase-like isoleucine patch superfamily enzyme